MELYEYIRIVKAYQRLILGVTVAGIFIALGVSAFWSQQQQGSLSLIIRPRVIERTEGFQFTDVLEASDRVTRMTENWLKQQGLGIKTKRLGNQFIAVSFPASDEGFAKEKADNLNIQTNSFLTSLSPQQGLGAFEALITDFSFTKRDPHWKTSGIIGFLTGLFIGAFVAFFVHYAKGQRRTS